MITIPIWSFILLVVLAGFTTLSVILVTIFFLIFTISDLIRTKEQIKYYESSKNCPYEIEADYPDYNPEYIPPEER